MALVLLQLACGADQFSTASSAQRNCDPEIGCDPLPLPDPPPAPPPPPPNYDVGVISAGTCPGGAPVLKNYMDGEDDWPPGGSSWGWHGAITSTPYGGVTFHWCRVDGRRFWPIATTLDPKKDYAVLMMGTACPNGSRKFHRYFDNEDSDNQNWPKNTSLGPNNILTANAQLSFCLFRAGTTTMSAFPSLGVPYGVFAASDFPLAIMAGGITSDEENSQNISSFVADADIRAEAARIIQPILDRDPIVVGSRTNLMTVFVSP